MRSDLVKLMDRLRRLAATTRSPITWSANLRRTGFTLHVKLERKHVDARMLEPYLERMLAGYQLGYELEKESKTPHTEGGDRMTRAKFMCVSVKKQVRHGGDTEFLYESEFAAVMNGSEENKQFFAWSPSGSIRLSTMREDHFVAGKEYYVDFTGCVVPAPQVEAATPSA